MTSRTIARCSGVSVTALALSRCDCADAAPIERARAAAATEPSKNVFILRPPSDFCVRLRGSTNLRAPKGTKSVACAIGGFQEIVQGQPPTGCSELPGGSTPVSASSLLFPAAADLVASALRPTLFYTHRCTASAVSV